MRKFLYVCSVVLCAASCFRDEPRNNECDILSAWVDEAMAEYFYGPSGMIIDGIPSNSSHIEFSVKSLATLPKAVAVSFTLTPGAVISPESGSPQDFTEGPVTYTVTSEDGAWKRTYTVGFTETAPGVSKLSFENFEAVTSGFSSTTSFHVFYEMDADGQKRNIWASGNEGVSIMNSGWSPEQFPTYATPEGYSGHGACLNTQSAGALGAMMGKPIAAGNLFIGRFIVDNVLTDALKATEFGIPVDFEPGKVTGWYKYSPGKTFTDKDRNVIPDRTDQASIYAVFWRNTDVDGNPVSLFGDNVLTSPWIVSKAEVASLPATDTWSTFEMTFEGGRADKALLEARGYNFTLVFSSSKGGDVFEGAIGSTLVIDEVEIIHRED